MTLSRSHRRLVSRLLVGASALALWFGGECFRLISLHEEVFFSCRNPFHIAVFALACPLVVGLGGGWLTTVAWAVRRGLVEGAMLWLAPAALWGMGLAGETTWHYATYDPSKDPSAFCDAEGRRLGSCEGAAAQLPRCQ
jgi:hypothetical protein